MKPKVLITYNIFGELYRSILTEFDVTIPAPGVESFTYDEVLSVIGEYDALLSMWNFPVDERLLAAAKKLKIVANYAVGYDNIDVSAATKQNIVVANTPDPVTAPTADIAMGLIISLLRGIPAYDKRQRVGGYVKGIMTDLGYSLSGKQLGILGMGRIGKALATRAKAFGMCVAYNNRNRLSVTEEQQYDAQYMTFDELISTSDILSINAPLIPDTYHIIDADALSKMKPGAYIVNTARGPLIDEKSLVEALRNKKIAGAGLDVYEFNDTVSKELTELDNTVLLPHIGTQTVEARRDMAKFAATNIRNFFYGGRVARVN
ncbi:MAG: dihydrofolate reductase [Bacteroidaceae bacterium]|nr:dihydrofolate reductase [Bacteroidaceae bacterium]